MKIKVRELRKMIREALNDLSPQTRRGGVGRPAPHNDDLEPAVPTQHGIAPRPRGPEAVAVSRRGPATQRGMGLDSTADSLMGNWEDHVATSVDTSALDAKECVGCGHVLPVGAVSCPNCDAMSVGPKTMRSPGVRENFKTGQKPASHPPAEADDRVEPTGFTVNDLFDFADEKVTDEKEVADEMGFDTDKKSMKEMKLGLASASRGNFSTDWLFDEKPFERDSESDMDDEFELDRGEQLVLGGKGLQTDKHRSR